VEDTPPGTGTVVHAVVNRSLFVSRTVLHAVVSTSLVASGTMSLASLVVAMSAAS
jgi:hypothetical protein